MNQIGNFAFYDSSERKESQLTGDPGSTIASDTACCCSSIPAMSQGDEHDLVAE